MKVVFIITVGLGTILIVLSSCIDKGNNDQKCNELDYTKYVRCIRRKYRFKRSEECEDTCIDPESCTENCNDCNCDYCTVDSCEQFCLECCQSTTCSTIGCCHRTCHAQCRTSMCRHECKKDCNSNIQQLKDQSKDLGNITTVITLNAFVNNTNVIDVPISVGNTNTSFLYPNLVSDILFGVINTILTNNQTCCNVVGPPNCSATYTWPFCNCTHPINRECGPFCKSSIVHRQPIKNCLFDPCLDQTMHIPQPQPRCIYHPIWPYTICGMQQQQPFCGGCYSHYGAPFQQPPSYCSAACYDEGYGVGPYYRQGPFYRRYFGHVPSCFQMGTCSGRYSMGFGYFGPFPLDLEMLQPNIPSVNYPFVFNRNSDGLLYSDVVKVENVEKLTTDPSFSDIRPLVTLEAHVNYTTSLKTRIKSNKATVTIETGGKT